MPHFDANGASLYFELTGNGPPLVLVHGFACGLRMWDPQLQALARSFQIVTCDVRGHGRSEAPSDPAAYSPSICVDDLRALLDHLEIGRTALAGLSMGGNIALHFALAHPERLTALIVADTGSGSDGTSDFAAGVERMAEALERNGIEAFAEASLFNPAFGRYAKQGPEAERLIRSCLTAHPARGLAHTARGVVKRRPSIYALAPALRALSIPTLLIVGEHDEPCVPVHRFMADTIPGAQHVVISGAGHLSNLEAPYEFNRAIENFLGGLP